MLDNLSLLLGFLVGIGAGLVIASYRRFLADEREQEARICKRSAKPDPTSWFASSPGPIVHRIVAWSPKGHSFPRMWFDGYPLDAQVKFWEQFGGGVDFAYEVEFPQPKKETQSD